MDNDEKIVLFKTDLRHAVVLPDGKQPLPLGSGSIAGIKAAVSDRDKNHGRALPPQYH
jgi:hypothetical protein